MDPLVTSFRTRSFSVFSLLSVLSSVGGQPGSAPTDIRVVTSTYLGGGNDADINEVKSIAVNSKGEIFIAGTGGFNYGIKPVTIPGDFKNSDGFVLKLSKEGNQVTSVYRAEPVRHICANRVGDKQRYLLAGGFGIALYQPDLTSLSWKYEAVNCSAENCRLSLARDGTVVIYDRQMQMLLSFQEDGTRLGTLTRRSITRTHHDVIIDPVYKRILFSYHYRSQPDTQEVDIPCVFAYDYQLQTRHMKAWCVGGQQVLTTNNMANSHPELLYYNDFDQYIYLAGTSYGPNTIFRYDPSDIRGKGGNVGITPTMGPTQLRSYDNYTSLDQVPPGTAVTFIARLSPRDLGVDKAQFIVARDDDGVGSSVRTVGLVTDTRSDVYTLQNASYAIENRKSLSVNGSPCGAFMGKDAAVLAVSTSFSAKKWWNVFQQTAGAVYPVDIDVGREYAVAVVKSKVLI